MPIAFGRRALLAGAFTGQTQLSASGNGLCGLVHSLHTQTGFSIKQSALLRFDL